MSTLPEAPIWTWIRRLTNLPGQPGNPTQPNNQGANSVTTPTTISIDGTEYVRASDLPAGPPTEHRIVVADRGWVFVGNTTQDDHGISLTDAKCIRYWGTDSSKPGLGWLAANGPTDKTKLDPSGTVRIPTHAVVATFDTEASKWL